MPFVRRLILSTCFNAVKVNAGKGIGLTSSVNEERVESKVFHRDRLFVDVSSRLVKRSMSISGCLFIRRGKQHNRSVLIDVCLDSVC